MKSSKSFAALLVAPLFFVALAFAAEAPAPASKIANCCSTAVKEGKTCAHACCVEAAKAGNNCTKCGGSGPLAKPAEKK